MWKGYLIVFQFKTNISTFFRKSTKKAIIALTVFDVCVWYCSHCINAFGILRDWTHLDIEECFQDTGLCREVGLTSTLAGNTFGDSTVKFSLLMGHLFITHLTLLRSFDLPSFRFSPYVSVKVIFLISIVGMLFPEFLDWVRF